MGRQHLLPAAVMLGACLAARPARACDVCAIYVATELREDQVGFSLGLGEQLSRFQTLQDEGHEIPGGGQALTSSITQLAVGYDVVPELGLQFTMPLIVRDFRRPEDGELRSGSENGLGDVSLLAMLRPYSHMGENTMVRLTILAGVEFPTGSTDRLKEELDEDHEHEGDDDHEHDDAELSARLLAHGDEHHDDEGAPSGIHGHDLALGSGSFDGIVGATLFASWRRGFATAAVQYAIRDQGDFGYQYANDLTWSGGPGAYLLLEHTYSLSLQGMVSGERKENDTLHGIETDDTAITALYLGPSLAFTWDTALAASAWVELPVVQDNTGVQLVPDFRLHLGIDWHL